ncbi:F0F1 ATP synthase subunit epsilon [Pararhodobacter sp. SW119]|uniref:F0F1 ATP synthase subunit epsilon n=1 Tax=Pararhodobacter sp. SW119 TaxID=2780075 RepID=UPI001ADF2132|nr:F0F1 ATP synthase subunit epsilon [Pararhodobacter sp. SW119]
MADTMQFDLVSPERMLASVPATEVQIPGAEGDFTAMPGHVPFISTLRPGIVIAATDKGEIRYVVTGGFAEVTGEHVSLLAERSLLAEELKQPEFDEMVTEAKTSRDATSGPEYDAANKHFADIMEMGRQLGLQASTV